jgi:hypothetical protein
MVLPENWTIVQCTSRHGTIEIAMAVSALAGFLSWLEATPPGAIPEPPYPSRTN